MEMVVGRKELLDREIDDLESRKRELECYVASLEQKSEEKSKVLEVLEGSLMEFQVKMKEYQNLGEKELKVWYKQLELKGFVEKLIANKQQLLAIDCVYEFNLVNIFPPMDLLKQYVLDLKSAGETTKPRGLAISEEISGLKKVMECISGHNLEAEYSPDGIRERIAELEAQRISLDRTSHVYDLPNEVQAPPAKKPSFREGHF